jgi:predicted lactoylglutathione lyase
MKIRTYVAKCYIDVSEEEVLNYAIDLKGCKDKDEFFEKGYTITDADWDDYADSEFMYGEHSYDDIELLKETEE